jgi:hypothetical protein
VKHECDDQRAERDVQDQRERDRRAEGPADREQQRISRRTPQLRIAEPVVEREAREKR